MSSFTCTNQFESKDAHKSEGGADEKETWGSNEAIDTIETIKRNASSNERTKWNQFI